MPDATTTPDANTTHQVDSAPEVKFEVHKITVEPVIIEDGVTTGYLPTCSCGWVHFCSFKQYVGAENVGNGHLYGRAKIKDGEVITDAGSTESDTK